MRLTFAWLPHELEWAEARLTEAESAVAQQRNSSTWISERSTWTRLDFVPFALASQGSAARTLNIAEMSRILSPNSRSWQEQELAGLFWFFVRVLALIRIREVFEGVRAYCRNKQRE